MPVSTEILAVNTTPAAMEVIETKDGLSSRYTRTEGSYIMDTMMTYDSGYMFRLFEERTKELNKDIQRFVNKARFENYMAAYTALKCKCDAEYESFMNVQLWKDILENFCDRTHSQHGIVAIVRAAMIVVNKEIWRAFLSNAKKSSEEKKTKENSKKYTWRTF